MKPGRMRILMVAPTFSPSRGGVETHVLEVGRRLAEDPRFEIAVLTTDLSGELPARETMHAMTVERVPARPRRADLYWSPAVYRRVGRALADVVHVQGYHTFVPPLAMLAARRARLPYVVTFHSGGHSSRLRQVVRPAQVRLLRPLLRSARALVAVSRFEARLFGSGFGIGADRIMTIPNGADLPAGADPGPMEREAGLILSVGRLERYKGHGRMVEALPLVRAGHPAARLLILGHGPQEAELRRLAERHGVGAAVEIRGLPRDELPALVRRASVVALMSEYESHGLAVHEALALGARVVVNDASALAEVRDLPQVVAVRPGAPPAELADAIEAQLIAPDPSPDDVPALPTWDDCAASLASLYERVVAGGSARPG